MGWNKATPDQRRTLVSSWVRHGLHSFDARVLENKSQDFSKAFDKPDAGQVQSEIHLTFWAQEPSGMRCGTGFTKLRYRIGAAGGLLERKSIDSFFVPCTRPRP
jgi:hypothetical protein